MTFIALGPHATSTQIINNMNYLMQNAGLTPNGVTIDPTTGAISNQYSNTVLNYLNQYILIAYATNSTGTTGFSYSPTNATYYGIRNQADTTPTANPADYTWVQGTFGTTNFLYYTCLGGRKVEFDIASVVPAIGYVQTVDSVPINLDLITTVSSVGYADVAGVAYTVTTHAQPNITSVGLLNSLTVTGNVTAANFIGRVATANYANFAGTAFNVTGSNVTGTVALATHANIADVANSVVAGNIIGNVAYANYANFAGTAFNVTGSNVTGIVALATHANIADLANSVAGSNVTGTVALATHANIADLANSVAGSNVTGTVALATHANVADLANNIGVLTNITVTGNVVVGPWTVYNAGSNLLFSTGGIITMSLAPSGNLVLLGNVSHGIPS